MTDKIVTLKPKTVLFKKYEIIKKIDEGSFGKIYLSKNIKTKEKYAIKVEPRKPNNSLEREAYILFYLRGPGLPEVKSFGKTTNFYVLIQTLLGPSLSSLLDDRFITFTFKDICILSIQMIERLEYIHSKNYIHRDIKPHNFLMGIKDPSMVYIIDFGLAKKYRSKKGNHIKFRITNNITGTPRYCSYNALRGAEQSRRDDLESLFYVIIYFFRGNLPWQNLKIKSRTERFNKINVIKKNIDYKILCKNLPQELYLLGIYIKHLNFEKDPDYNYIKRCFYKILSNIGERNDYNFSWFNDDITKIYKHKNNVSHGCIFRTNSSHKRLYDKISSSLEKKRRNLKRNSESTMPLNSHPANSIKDNLTLISINIENNKINNDSKNNNDINNEIKKSFSYIKNKEIRPVKKMKKKESLVNNNIVIKTDFNNYISDKNSNNNCKLNNDNNNYNYIIKRNQTQMKNSIKKINFGNKSNSDIFHFYTESDSNEGLKNIFLRSNKILYNSPSSVIELKQNSIKNIKSDFLDKGKEDNKKYKILNRNKILKNNLNPKFQSENNINNMKIISTKKINNINNIKNINRRIINKSLNNINKNVMNKNNNLYIIKKNMKLSNLTNRNRTYKSIFSPNMNELNQIKRINTSTLLKIKNLKINNLIKSNNIEYKSHPIKLKNINNYNSYNMNNQNINLNIKLINNNNYNNILLKNSNSATKNKMNIPKKINDKKLIKFKIKKKLKTVTTNIPSQNNDNNGKRIIKYKIKRKSIPNNVDNFNFNISTNDIEEKPQNKIRIMNIPFHKTQLDNKNFFNNSNMLI